MNRALLSSSSLTQELNSALVERDRAIFERNELLEKYCHEVKDKAVAQKELDQACKDIETVKEERDVARKERTEAIIQRDHLLREYYQARQVLARFLCNVDCITYCIYAPLLITNQTDGQIEEALELFEALLFSCSSAAIKGLPRTRTKNHFRYNYVFILLKS